MITIYYGEDVTAEQAAAFAARIRDAVPRPERRGHQRRPAFLRLIISVGVDARTASLSDLTHPMPTIRVVTDSTCDLPDSLVRQYGITVVPVNIHLGDRPIWTA